MNMKQDGKKRNFINRLPDYSHVHISLFMLPIFTKMKHSKNKNLFFIVINKNVEIDIKINTGLSRPCEFEKEKCELQKASNFINGVIH